MYEFYTSALNSDIPESFQFNDDLPNINVTVTTVDDVKSVISNLCEAGTKTRRNSCATKIFLEYVEDAKKQLDELSTRIEYLNLAISSKVKTLVGIGHKISVLEAANDFISGKDTYNYLLEEAFDYISKNKFGQNSDIAVTQFAIINDEIPNTIVDYTSMVHEIMKLKAERDIIENTITEIKSVTAKLNKENKTWIIAQY